MENLAEHKEAILWHLILENVWKICKENSNFFKISQEQGHFA
jgi:hypothetical protein